MTDRPTGAKPIIVDGVTFRCYPTGVLRHVWRSEDGRIEVARRTSSSETYTAKVDGQYIWTGDSAKRFRSQKTAMLAGVRSIQGSVL